MRSVELHPNLVTGYINAGGRGTRLNGLLNPDSVRGNAKALMELGHPPIKLIDHHINTMTRAALAGIVVGAGDQNSVVDYIDTRYRTRNDLRVHGIELQYGTAGDLLTAVRHQDEWFGDQILIKNVDTILEIDDIEFAFQHIATNALATIALTRRRNVPNEGAFHVAESAKVVFNAEADTDTSPPSAPVAYQASSTGAVMVSKEFLLSNPWCKDDGQLSLYKHVLNDAFMAEGLYAYDNGLKFFQDVGTVDSWLDAASSDVIQEQLEYEQNNEKEICA